MIDRSDAFSIWASNSCNYLDANEKRVETCNDGSSSGESLAFA